MDFVDFASQSSDSRVGWFEPFSARSTPGDRGFRRLTIILVGQGEQDLALLSRSGASLPLTLEHPRASSAWVPEGGVTMHSTLTPFCIVDAITDQHRLLSRDNVSYNKTQMLIAPPARGRTATSLVLFRVHKYVAISIPVPVRCVTPKCIGKPLGCIAGLTHTEPLQRPRSESIECKLGVPASFDALMYMLTLIGKLNSDSPPMIRT